jgi:hypothetical protein
VLGGDVRGGIAGAGVHDDHLVHDVLDGGEASGQRGGFVFDDGGQRDARGHGAKLRWFVAPVSEKYGSNSWTAQRLCKLFPLLSGLRELSPLLSLSFANFGIAQYNRSILVSAA